MSFPFTFRGIANWAARSKTGVFVYTLAVGFAVASVIGWFIWIHWLPVWESALIKLPPGTFIKDQRLVTLSPTSASLAENRFISISIRTDLQSEISTTSDLNLILDIDNIRIGSLFGFISMPYPSGYIIELDPDKVQPWWLSRSFFFYLGGFVLIWFAFSILWRALSIIYFVPIFIAAYLWGRRSSFEVIYRLILLSLMPPALFMTVALALYGAGQLNLQELLVANLIHIPMGWGIMLLSSRKLEITKPASNKSAEPNKRGKNPFGSSEESSGQQRSENPFNQTET